MANELYVKSFIKGEGGPSTNTREGEEPAGIHRLGYPLHLSIGTGPFLTDTMTMLL